MNISDLHQGQQVTIGTGRTWWQVSEVGTVPGTTLMRATITRTDNAGRSHLKVFTAREVARGALTLVSQ